MKNIWMSSGIQVIPAAHYRQVIAAHAETLLLLITTEQQHLPLIEAMQLVSGHCHTVIVAVTAEDCHLADVIRVPQLRYCSKGSVVRSIVLNVTRGSTVIEGLREMGFLR